MLRGNNFQLVYASRAIRQHDQQSLTKMLSQFKESNRDLNVTGLLLYDDFGVFVQLIEGEEATIKGLYSKIARDQRHTQVTLLHEQFTFERIFPDWRMGFQFFGESSLADLRADEEIDASVITSSFLKENQVLFLELLWCFRQEA